MDLQRTMINIWFGSYTVLYGVEAYFPHTKGFNDLKYFIIPSKPWKLVCDYDINFFVFNIAEYFVQSWSVILKPLPVSSIMANISNQLDLQYSFTLLNLCFCILTFGWNPWIDNGFHLFSFYKGTNIHHIIINNNRSRKNGMKGSGEFIAMPRCRRNYWGKKYVCWMMHAMRY